jgi:hypothetical protein
LTISLDHPRSPREAETMKQRNKRSSSLFCTSRFAPPDRHEKSARIARRTERHIQQFSSTFFRRPKRRDVQSLQAGPTKSEHITAQHSAAQLTCTTTPSAPRRRILFAQYGQSLLFTCQITAYTPSQQKPHSRNPSRQSQQVKRSTTRYEFTG